MSTHTEHKEINETYFCTFTCFNWISLFEEAQAYDDVYNWFDKLRSDGCHILAYVIMPNHLHCLLFPTNQKKKLNRLISEGKRFMSYAIVKKLSLMGRSDMLNKLKAGVQENERKKGKKHQVFRLSFDARICHTVKMTEQKLDYIHHNPVKGKWALADDYTKYAHSSAAYYELGASNKYITHYLEVNAVE